MYICTCIYTYMMFACVIWMWANIGFGGNIFSIFTIYMGPGNWTVIMSETNKIPCRFKQKSGQIRIH